MILTILFVQTAVTLFLVFLRTHSAKKTLAKSPTGIRSWLRAQLQNGKIVDGLTWNTGALRKELIKQWAKKPCLYTNAGDRSILPWDSVEEIDHLKKLLDEGKNNGSDKSELNSQDISSKHNKNNKTIWGFFHPYCNAGGGGEKVLWKAVETTLNHDLDNIVAIYTGDLNIDSNIIIENVTKRFDYKLDSDRIVFIYLKKRWLVDSATWPYVTLLGQAIGSIVLTIEAILKCPPDIWCDTMGYPFGYPFVAHLLRIPIVTYTHYPIISSDMLNKLQLSQSSSGLKKYLKLLYWKFFMWSYKHIGSYITIATTNSTWTNNHIKNIWSQTDTKVIYPPCSSEKLVINDSDHDTIHHSRENYGIVIAQFRPEKRHNLIIESYAKYYNNRISLDAEVNQPILKLKFIGSTRSQDDKDYVCKLKKLCEEYKIPNENIEFLLDAPYDEIKRQLYKATYGINAMWNEHFGIAVVEYIASGLIPLVHASAGPYLDIVSSNVGFFFKDSSDPDYTGTEKGAMFPTLTELFEKADHLTKEDKLIRSKQGMKDALDKFSDEQFDIDWIKNIMHKFEN